jgi:hypothetical protein
MTSHLPIEIVFCGNGCCSKVLLLAGEQVLAHIVQGCAGNLAIIAFVVAKSLAKDAPFIGNTSLIEPMD